MSEQRSLLNGTFTASLFESRATINKRDRWLCALKGLFNRHDLELPQSSVSRIAVALLKFLPGTAWAWLIPANHLLGYDLPLCCILRYCANWVHKLRDLFLDWCAGRKEIPTFV
jgi:hypothetical protein